MCFYRFFHLDLVDLDAEQFVFEIIVEIEAVSILHVFPSRILVEDACFPAGQGLQRTPELPLLCTGPERTTYVMEQILLSQLSTSSIFIKIDA